MSKVTLDGPTTGYVRKVKIGGQDYNFSVRVEYESNLKVKNQTTGLDVQVPEKGTSKATQLYSPAPNVWVTSAVLGADGKWVPLKKSESKDLLGNSYYPPSQGNEYVLGSGALTGLNSVGPNTLRDISINDAKVLYKKYTGSTDQQVNSEFDVSSNVAPPGSPPTPGLLGPPPAPDLGQAQPTPTADYLDPNKAPVFPTPTDDTRYDGEEKNKKIKEGGASFLKYPEGMRDDQDRIIFERCPYVAKLAAEPTDPYPHAGPARSTIILPIQSGISDTNSVDWGGANLNPVEMFGVRLAMDALSNKKFSEVVIDGLDKFQETVNTTNNRDMLKYYFAQEAVGVQGLLSRASGSVLNPNLSLLFNGPSLRPFSFTFRLSPRGPKESIIVKKIIRQFKEGSAVNTAESNVFLKAPDVFKIRYEGASAKSLNKFKTCALTSVSVNYTPDGTYMTYGDGTMTSYELSLTFNELDPIYQVNYRNLDLDEIGY